MTENDRITVEDLPIHVSEGTSPELADPIEESLDDGSPMMAAVEQPEAAPAGADKAWPYSLDAVIREASKLALIRALQATQGNCHRAAELLGVSRYTVYRMLNRFGMAEGRSYRTFRKPIVRQA